MMAERKRKVKWSLNPRGKDWSQNSNKFGQKILEKMGWSEGKGLGANEDGMTSHIRVAYKNDTQGMGFKDRDDQWTEHQANFTKLLNTLVEPKEGDDKVNGEVKLESLEKKSKSSKARVHYHKFTRGKDLSRYSEKDLANIFGKKKLDELSNTKNEEIEKTDEKENQEGKSFGVVTHNGGNMLDYFKKKLPNFKNSVTKITPEEKDCDSESETCRPSFGLGFSKNDSIAENNPDNRKYDKKKVKSNGYSEPADNFRRNCFGLGYDRHNNDDSKPKSKFTSFVKASCPQEQKEPLEYGISLNKKKNLDDTNSSDHGKQNSGLGANTSKINKIQSSFMSFVKGSNHNDDIQGDEIFVDNKEKVKKRKRKNEEDYCNEEMDGKKKKKCGELDTSNPNNIEGDNYLGTNTSELDKTNDIEENESGVQKKNKKKNRKKHNGEGINNSQELNDSVLCQSNTENDKPKSSIMSFIKDTLSMENDGNEKKKKKKGKGDKPEQINIENIEAVNGIEDDSESIIVKKKKKSYKTVNGISDEDTSTENSKKRKSDSELDVAFTPMKKKFKNFEDLHVLQDEEKIVQTPKKFKKNKKSKKDRCADNNEGLSNPAFDPLHTEVNHTKHHLDPILEEPDNISESPVDVRIEKEADVTMSKTKSKKNKGEKSADSDNVDPAILEKCDKKNKKKKSKSLDGIDNLCIEDVPEENKPEKKIKKKKYKSLEGLDNPCLEDVIMDEASQNADVSVVSEKEGKKKSKKSKKNSSIGIENSAFNDNVESEETTGHCENQYEVKKKEKKHKEPEVDAEKKKKKKNKISETVQEIENPCFNLDDSIGTPEVTPNKYEVKRTKSKECLGIVNPALDITSPLPANNENNGTVKEDLPVMDDGGLMLNVVCTPIIKKESNKKLQRRKSVRFSDFNQSIFINNMDSPADLIKNAGGVDNAAYDQLGNHIEENIDTLNKQLDDYQAEVENDLNEAKLQVMVGEPADPNGENEILPNGEVKLRLKYAKFGRLPPWMKKNDKSPKSSYRHLIKGDIVLGFRNTNMHLIEGYNCNVNSCT